MPPNAATRTQTCKASQNFSQTEIRNKPFDITLTVLTDTTTILQTNFDSAETCATNDSVASLASPEAYTGWNRAPRSLSEGLNAEGGPRAGRKAARTSPLRRTAQSDPIPDLHGPARPPGPDGPVVRAAALPRCRAARSIIRSPDSLAGLRGGFAGPRRTATPEPGHTPRRHSQRISLQKHPGRL